MQQWIIDPLIQPRRTRNDDDRRFLGIGAGDRITNAEPANTVSDAYRSHAVNPGISIRGKAGTIFSSASDDLNGTLFEHAVEGQHIIARNAEDRANPVIF